MATPAVMSHDAATAHATAEDRESFFHSGLDLDLSLKHFSVSRQNKHRSMAEPEEENSVLPRGQELQVPTHPISSMQAAFAESMLDAIDDSYDDRYDRWAEPAARRKLLLEQDIEEGTHAGRWKQKPGQRYHELWKLVAQISFGIYLLLNGMARDDDQALNILQKHVDEVDSFLESTVEDFDLAQDDIEARLKNLKLPLENIYIFDGMLEDRAFRNTIVEGNETIEHIITRTAAAMNDSLRSVQQGMEATREFKKWMADMEHRKDWQEDRPEEKMKLFEKLKLFDAMNGNADGWYKAFVMLQTKGNHLGVSLVQLGTIVAEIDKRAAEISRRARVSISSDDEPLETLTSKQFSLAMSPTEPKNHTWVLENFPTLHMRKVSLEPSQRSRHSTRPSIVSITKELPSDPAMITPAIAATLPAFQMVAERERTPQPEEDDDSESDSDDDEEATVQYLTLQPRTYTPPPLTPSRYTPPTATARTVVKPPASDTERESLEMAIPEKSSLRKRLSKQQKSAPPPLLTTATYSSSSSQSKASSSSRASSNNRANHSRVRSQSMSSAPQYRVQSLETSQRTREVTNADFPRPPTVSFGDSYPRTSDRSYSRSPMRQHPVHPPPIQHRYSDYEEPTIDERIASMAETPNMEYHAFIASAQPSRLHDFNTGGNYVSSPRSEMQMTLQPVLASPSSPLQRPWTATPEPRGPSGRHPHMLGSMGHSYSANATLTVNNTGGARGSHMSQATTASEMTVGIGADGKKMKKKKSGFGWLKKAFSLSEEEKAEFEEKRRRDMAEEEEWRRRQPVPRVFLDGKRVHR